MGKTRSDKNDPKKKTISIAERIFSSSQCYTKSFTLAHVQRQWPLKTIASTTNPVIFRVIRRPTDRRELASRKLFFPCTSTNMFSVPGRGSAGTIRRRSSKYGYRVDLSLSTLAMCALLATSGSLHLCTTAIPAAHPPPGGIYPQCAES